MKTKIQNLFTRSFIAATWCAGSVILISATAQAQTNIFLFTGSETNITLAAGTYNITAYGAQGGGGTSGGLGAEMEGQFSFAGVTTLTILAGGGGGGNAGGGGGGSFVVKGSTPLVVAGGGGGVGFGGGAGHGIAGVTNANGSTGAGPYGGSGGTGGGGGGTYGSGGESGGGGGGFSSNGGVGNQGAGGGISFLGGGAGAAASSGGFASGGAGGFGGGGGGGVSSTGGGGGYGGGGSGGGGGGYSGGGGGGDCCGGGNGGGGGGSIIDSSSITNLAEISGIASPDGAPNGEIIITTVSTASAPTLPAIGITTVSSLPVVVWPASATNYVLQMTTNLNSPNWVTISNGIPFVGLQITNGPANAFFQLH